MKRLIPLVFCLSYAPAAFGQYVYSYTESFTSGYSSHWTANGTVNTYATGLADSSSSSAGSLISTYSIPYTSPANSGMYEVETTLNLSGSGGTFVTYLDATSNALSHSGSTTGTFYSVEMSPTFTGGVCSLTINVNKAISGTVTALGSTSSGCTPTTVVRSVEAWNFILVYVNGYIAVSLYDNSITSGQAGVGVAGAGYPNTLASVGLGELDVVSPNAVNASSIGTSSFSNRVDIQWQGTTDNSGGSGVALYQLYRGGTYVGEVPAIAADGFSDTTVTAGSSYTYTLRALDYHLNQANTTFNVTIPASGAVDPRQTGVRPTGAYWGASPEQIDLLSGNLTFSLPLLKAQQRGGAGVGFSLSYNSQNWRKDTGGVWNLGRDVGYGYGWKLLAGSITPYWSNYYTIDHYTFTDSTGAEYRLSTNNGGNVWNSSESVYLQYDANAGVLHFPDGTFWTFGCESAGTEQDAGTYYPTVMEDTNGNQILITYHDGIGTWWANSSARINTIEDVRATDPLGIYYTYAFTYNSDSIPHLTSIANSIGTGETYNLSYSSFTLDDPFTSSSFGTVTKLTEVSLPNDSSANYQFTSDSSGQLTKAQLIYGGYIRWTYASQTYVSSRTQMEIAERYLSKDGTSGSEQGYPLYHESGTSSLTIHSCAMIDGSSVGEKYWTFSPSGSSMGLATYYQGRAPTSSPCSATPASTAMTQNAYTWSQDSAGNNYVSSVVATLDPGQTYAASKMTTQALDTNGNVTSLKNCDYSATCSGAYRQYAYSYLNSSAYTSRYIFNRLSSATVTTNGSTFTTLATIGYDGFSLGGSGTPLGWDTSYGSITVRGNPTSMTDVSGIYSTTSYDLFGNVMGATNASGVSSSVTTNSSTNYAAPSQITVGSSLTTTMSYNSFLGLTGETGPNTTSISIGYDTNARPTSSTSPFGATTSTAYNDSSSGSTCTMVDNRWTQTMLDGLGRPLHVYTGHGSSCGSGTTLTEADSTYAPCGCSPLGKLKTQTVPFTPGSSGATTTYTYDGIGRTLSKAVVGTGSTPDTQGTTYYIYQGNLVTVFDPASNWKIFATDGFGNLTQVTEPNPSGGTAYTTYYTYDVLGHLIEVQMPRPGFSTTQTRSWSYTGNFLSSATNPENGTIYYNYNTGGNNKVSKRTDAKGQATVYTYDSLARLTEVQRYPSGTGNPEDTCQRENYYYDGSNPLSSSYPTNALGRLSAVQYQGGYNPYASTPCDTTFTEMYNYGVPGSPVGKQLTVARGSGSFNLAATYTYDTEGRMTNQAYPTDHSGTTANLSYTFDAMGRLNTMTDNIATQTIVTAATYGPANETLSIAGGTYFGAWAGETRTYNSLKQLTALASGALSINYTFPSTYNNGKISSQTDTVSGETVTYTYDALNRLATAENQSTFSPSWGQQFTYDGFGNLTNTSVIQGSAPSMTASYDYNNHAGGEDANGNPGYVPDPAFGSSGAAIWDVENRLLMLWQSTPVMSYAYDPANKRVWRGTWTGSYGSYTRGSTDEITFWSITGQKLATYNVTTSGSTIYATQSGTNYYFGAKLIKNNNGWVYADRLGSIGRFYPYGIERPSATTNGTEKFTGYFRDSETGNDYADQRYISPGWGRFVTPDRNPSPRLAAPGSWNRYAYTRGDPVNRVDRTGNDDDCIGGVCQLIDSPEDNPSDDTASVCESFGGLFSDAMLGMGGCLQAIDACPTVTSSTAFAGPLTAGVEADLCNEVGDPTAPTQADPTCQQILTQSIQTFLQTSDSALLNWDPNLAADLVGEGALVGVDPRLMASIATLESGHGSTFGGNNPFGLGPGFTYGTPSEAVNSAGVTLKHLIGYGDTVVVQPPQDGPSLYSGLRGIANRKGGFAQVPGYCQGSGCQAAGGTVAGFLSSFAGAPNVGLSPGNPNSLGYPCP